MKRIPLILAAAFIFFWHTAPVKAHKVTVFAWVEDDTVHTQSKFSGSKKVKDGKIEVFDHLNQQIVTGTTDEQGHFAFPIPKTARTLKVVLTAGMGHSNHWQISAGELGLTTTVPPSETKATASAQTPKNHMVMDEKMMEQIVERAIERKLAPLKAQLAQQAWGLRDIVAGIGYIIGLMGLAAYVNYHKSSKGPS